MLKEVESVNTIIHATRPLPLWHCKLPQLLQALTPCLTHLTGPTSALDRDDGSGFPEAFACNYRIEGTDLAQQRTPIHPELPEFLAKML
jgi:hypothetical protein